MRVHADPSQVLWADFPSLGFDKDYIVVSVNIYTNNTGALEGSQVYACDKTNLYAGGGNYQMFSLPGYVEPIPAITYDNHFATMYLVETENSDDSFDFNPPLGLLRLFTITGAVGSETLTPTDVFPASSPWASWPGYSDFAPQTNSTVKISSNDSRVQSVVYRNGSLWCAQTVFLPVSSPTRSSVQWWQFTPDGTIQQFGRIDDPSGVNFYAFPSIAVNKFNNALIGYSRFSEVQYASANYSFRAFQRPRRYLRKRHGS